ncbi:MAG: hypothetical protein MK297_09675 [Planctomycetes bacterium]|nr:hypothetical protein [Planctomycetota bacterium]
MNRTPLALLLTLTAAACSGSDDAGSSPTIQTWTTTWGADQSTSFAFEGDLFAYLASEQHSDAFDANGDGDQLDSFPVVVDVITGDELQLGVAAQAMVWVEDHLYIDVMEVEGVEDFDGGGLGQRVLLHWTVGMTDPEYVVTLDLAADLALVSTGELAVALTSSSTTITDTSLAVFEVTNPTTPVYVLNQDVSAGTNLELLAEEDGLVFVGIDETSSGVDHNGDGDALDERVLALLDASYEVALGAYPDPLYTVGMALPAGDTPLLAEVDGVHNWVVAFLVDESDQDNGTTNSLNTIGQVGGSFSPCHPGDVDADIDDEVLHFMGFLEVTHGGVAVTNSGLVGGERIIYADGYVGTVSREGDEAGCDLNGDGDLNDRVFRWVLADRNNLTHENDDSRLHALGNIGGSSGEIAEMGDRFVIIVNESADGRDQDGHGVEDRDLVAWLAPSSETAWTFHHDDDPDFGWVVATWLGEIPGTARVGVGFSEQSNDSPFDLNGDGDEVDSVPTFAYFDSGTGFMEFPGFAIGGDPDEMGIMILGNYAYYRVSEVENGGDLNGNGSDFDYMLWASELTTGRTVNVSLLNGLSGTSIWADPLSASCAAFLVDEGGVVGDVNGDGDTSGFAVGYLRF